jgi:farnesol kinase
MNYKHVQSSVAMSFVEWPFFDYCSTNRWGSLFAASIMGVNILKMLGIGLGIWKDGATVKSMSRFGDYRFHSWIVIYEKEKKKA